MSLSTGARSDWQTRAPQSRSADSALRTLPYLSVECYGARSCFSRLSPSDTRSERLQVVLKLRRPNPDSVPHRCADPFPESIARDRVAAVGIPPDTATPLADSIQTLGCARPSTNES